MDSSFYPSGDGMGTYVIILIYGFHTQNSRNWPTPGRPRAPCRRNKVVRRSCRNFAAGNLYSILFSTGFLAWLWTHTHNCWLWTESIPLWIHRIPQPILAQEVFFCCFVAFRICVFFFKPQSMHGMLHWLKRLSTMFLLTYKLPPKLPLRMLILQPM